MPITVYTGRPGSGKTLLMAREATNLIRRNKKYMERVSNPRYIWSNIKFSTDVEESFPYIKYWSDPRQLTELRDCDVLWDEMPAHLDATEWANMSLELKRWLQQHRKVGVEIYGTAQSFSQVDISARRLVSTLYLLTKLMGSRTPTATKPDPKIIWGVGIKRLVDPVSFDEQAPQVIGAFPGIFLMGKKSVSVFDTTQIIEVGEYPPLKHIARTCERHGKGCNFHKVIHK